VLWIVLGYIFLQRMVPLAKFMCCKKKANSENNCVDEEDVLNAVKDYNNLAKASQEAAIAGLLKKYPTMPPLSPSNMKTDRRYRAFIEDITAGAQDSQLKPLLKDIITYLSESSQATLCSKLVDSYGLPEFNKGIDEGNFKDRGLAGDDPDESSAGHIKQSKLEKWRVSSDWISWFNLQNDKAGILMALQSITSKSNEETREQSEREDSASFFVLQVNLLELYFLALIPSFKEKPLT